MGPLEALTSSIRGAFRFNGRASRAEFWWTWAILYLVAMLVMLYRIQPGLSMEAKWAATALLCALALPMISVGTRRLADAGQWRWWFVLTIAFGIATQVIYHVPVPAAGSLDNFKIQFDDKTVPASGLGYLPYVRFLQDNMAWVGRPLAVLCLILAVLPSRSPDAHPAEVTP